MGSRYGPCKYDDYYPCSFGCNRTSCEYYEDEEIDNRSPEEICWEDGEYSPECDCTTCEHNEECNGEEDE